MTKFGKQRFYVLCGFESLGFRRKRVLDFSKPPYAPMNLVFGVLCFKGSYASSKVARILDIPLLKIKLS